MQEKIDLILQSEEDGYIVDYFKCAQTSLIMASSTEKPVCCRNGNYRMIQCRRGMCRCVDSDGRQTAREAADVAKDILDKYGSPDDQSKALKPFVPSVNVPGNPGALMPMSPVPGGFLRKYSYTPIINITMHHNRSALDKVVDYLLRDGPNQRMALTCKHCTSHNGSYCRTALHWTK
ncbi:Uncharacterized protein OBRU01_04378 [Operophtera brumata]|uniref:Thyroglobulin type-1 domain-containing protein n=1 Tax=Operophtera brumata TaxID=104452 RepID=A0A0L7LPH3_OPEBR|nr:Uncharacterized protein OBRU01_04378 [Operophtera brumata]